jgi:hypothetical protein
VTVKDLRVGDVVVYGDNPILERSYLAVAIRVSAIMSSRLAYRDQVVKVEFDMPNGPLAPFYAFAKWNSWDLVQVYDPPSGA